MNGWQYGTFLARDTKTLKTDTFAEHTHSNNIESINGDVFFLLVHGHSSSKEPTDHDLSQINKRFNESFFLWQ